MFINHHFTHIHGLVYLKQSINREEVTGIIIKNYCHKEVEIILNSIIIMSQNFYDQANL